jgi:hypothetical protein
VPYLPILSVRRVAAGDNNLKAFDFVKETSTQLITLASGAVVLSATFYKDVLAGAPRHRGLLEWSWALFLVSILSGIGVLGALGHELKETSDPKDLDIYKWNVRGTSLSQQLIFLAAVSLFALFVILNMPGAGNKPEPAATAISGPVTVNGRVTANGPLTATGLVRATGPISASGPLTATGPVNAKGSFIIEGGINTRAPVKTRRGKCPNP